ncbi:hypothetical protein AAG906_016124 [Vitis piasezkii]
MSIKCSVEGCPWKITSHAVEENEILHVHTYQVNHNHIAQDKCLSKVRFSSKRDIVVVEDVLRELNHGTIANYTSHEGHFKQLFITHAFSIQGFIMGCRPVLSIDSFHLSGPYKEALLSAIAYDADNGMFPPALGVVGSKNYEDWYWFLEKLNGVLDGKEVIIISNRHQGILRSVSELFEIENHTYCYQHKGKEDVLLLLNSIAYDRLDIDYNEAFEKLVRFNNNLARWVAENSLEHWVMLKFLKKRLDKMTTNNAESFNAWLREKRHQIIYTLLLMHMDKLVGMLDTHMHGVYWEVYLVVDMQQHKCTCLTRQMSKLPCAHVCVVIRTLRHNVYEYIDPCFHVSTQHLIYRLLLKSERQLDMNHPIHQVGTNHLLVWFQPLPTHNIPKVCNDESLQDGRGNLFLSLQPSQVRRLPGRP